MSDVQMTHSDDCWKWHHECAKRAVQELRAENERLAGDVLKAENERLQAYIIKMVEKAADQKLDGYRELGARCAQLEEQIDALRAENERLRQDAERLDWLEKVASIGKVELAKSLLSTGFEIGEWPSMRVTMRKGTLRDVIDAAMKASGPPD